MVQRRLSWRHQWRLYESAVALKSVTVGMFWAKWQHAGIFVYAIRRSLLRFDHATIKPMTLRLIAISSILLWFIVAASGRWIDS